MPKRKRAATAQIVEMGMHPLLLTAEQAAAYLGSSVSLFAQQVIAGIVPPPVTMQSVAKDHRRWRREDLEEWVRRGCAPWTDELDTRRAAATRPKT